MTWLGSDLVLGVVIGAAAAFLALRRRWRLAVYLLVTGAGALVLDPVLKSLAGRLRPVVAHPIASGTGNSFPSGHSLPVCSRVRCVVMAQFAKSSQGPRSHARLPGTVVGPATVPSWVPVRFQEGRTAIASVPEVN